MDAEHSTKQTAPAGEGDPCPAPLSVAEVLETFHSESAAWSLEREEATLRGRTLGQGPPLLFLNGLGGTHELYALLVWLLRDDFRCILFDYPDEPAARTSASDLAADLFAIAEHHDCERFFVYATSFGSLVALAAMLERPQRIPRAVLQGGFAHRRLALVERALVQIGRRLPGTVSRLPLRELVQANNHRPWFPPFDAVRWRFFLENTGQVPIRSLAGRAAIVFGTDLREQLSRVSQPVLLLRSEGEGLVSTRSIDELAGGLPNARVEWMHSSGHLPYLTHPHRLAKLIRSFLTEEDPNGRAS